MVTRRVIGAVGPLAGLEDEFCVDLVRLGYASEVAVRHGRLLREVSRWLDERGHGVDEFVPDDFVADRAAVELSKRLSVTGQQSRVGVTIRVTVQVGRGQGPVVWSWWRAV